MSGTKLLSQKVPVTKGGIRPALLIVAHGERGGVANDRLAHSLVGRLKHSRRYRTVQTCFISKQPSLKTVLNKLSKGPVVIYPLFMSKGYYVKQMIPKLLAAAKDAGGRKNYPTAILEPVGLNPGLPKLVAELALSTIEASGLAADNCHLLLVAHGSNKDKASREATSLLAAEITKQNYFAGVEQSFLEERPFLEEQLKTIKGPAVAVGLFIGEGLHGVVDLPEAIKLSGRSDILRSLPLARWPLLKNLIYDDLNKNIADCS